MHRRTHPPSRSVDRGIRVGGTSDSAGAVCLLVLAANLKFVADAGEVGVGLAVGAEGCTRQGVVGAPVRPFEQPDDRPGDGNESDVHVHGSNHVIVQITPRVAGLTPIANYLP